MSASESLRTARPRTTAGHRYRVEKGIYPEPMRSVVSDLCDEIERLQKERDEIDAAFFAWRQKHYEEARNA